MLLQFPHTTETSLNTSVSLLYIFSVLMIPYCISALNSSFVLNDRCTSHTQYIIIKHVASVEQTSFHIFVVQQEQTKSTPIHSLNVFCHGSSYNCIQLIFFNSLQIVHDQDRKTSDFLVKSRTKIYQSDFRKLSCQHEQQNECEERMNNGICEVSLFFITLSL